MNIFMLDLPLLRDKNNGAQNVSSYFIYLNQHLKNKSIHIKLQKNEQMIKIYVHHQFRFYFTS